MYHAKCTMPIGYFKKIATQKRTVAVLFLLGSIFIAGVTYKREISRFVWKNSILDNIAYVLYPKDPSFLYELGNHYFGNGGYDIDKAEFYFKETIKIASDYPKAHYQLARINFINGDFGEAINEITKETDEKINKGVKFYMRGLIYGYAKFYDLAIEDFKKFTAYAPFDWAGWNDLSWIYFQKGDFKNAELSAKEGLKREPSNPWLLNSLGIALLNQGKESESEKFLRASLAGFESFSPKDWGMAYPGNNPDIYSEGLEKTIESIRHNLSLTHVDSLK